jgi:hypothetical protein
MAQNQRSEADSVISAPRTRSGNGPPYQAEGLARASGNGTHSDDRGQARLPVSHLHSRPTPSRACSMRTCLPAYVGSVHGCLLGSRGGFRRG